MKKVLITGASGMVGKRLTELLLAKGCRVNTLSRSAILNPNSQIMYYQWDVEKGTIDSAAFDGVDAIIHLAGAGVADERWTEKRKREIRDSRVDSTRLLFQFLKENKHSVRTIVSASAVGYYGDGGEEEILETRKPAATFLANVCVDWEKEVQQFYSLDIRHVQCRIGIVLSKNGGALPALTKTFPLGVTGYFSKSPLYYPWIHLDDVCGIFMHAHENETMQGAYNTTAPTPVSIRELLQEIVRAKKSNALLVPIPSVALKLLLGEMADMLLSSQRCSAQKILEAGYRFKFEKIQAALSEIYGGTQPPKNVFD